MGPLRPGREYTTVQFQPPITYEVQSRGWHNFEDLFGNLLLVPPGNDHEGVDAFTSDYIGMFRAVLPSKLSSPICGTEWPLGDEVGPTPREMVTYYREQPNLVVSNVHPAEVSGKKGVVLDIEANPHVPLDHCREGTTKVEVNSVISGVEGSTFEHGIIPGVTMRLYLLRDGERVFGIEVTDVHAAPATLVGMSRVAESVRVDG